MSEGSDKYNRGGLMAFMFSIVFVLVFFLYLVFIHPGVNLGEKVVDPLAQSTQSEVAVAAFDITKISAPWVSTPEIVEHGKTVYKANCAMCHGNSADGAGPAGAGLNPKPRNLVAGQWTQGQGLISHFKVLQNGIPGGSMAAFKHLKVGDRWSILHYIETVTTNKSKDDPAKVAEFAKSAE
ncbi:MAG: cytochrome c [Bdellovibrionaceae bacterium]|jgi:mono/diheme cytochrome c family protein|nr:cytochrome c [Pseudobdellovibrionaceae bacterium]